MMESVMYIFYSNSRKDAKNKPNNKPQSEIKSTITAIRIKKISETLILEKQKSKPVQHL